MKLLMVRILVIAMMALAISCIQHPTAGGGASEVEVVGVVYLSGKEPAPATQVKLIPYNYNSSIMAAIGDSMTDTSDMEGRYSFRCVAPGTYNVQAVHLKQRTRMLVTGVEVDSGTTVVPSQTLREPGVIRWLLLGSAKHNGYATIPGTDIAVFVAAGSNDIILDSVPAGTIPEVRYQILGDTAAISRNNVNVEAAETTILTNPLWRYQRRIYLNTSKTGAGINGSVYGFPVLIRLNENVFDFTQITTGGDDLRFTSSNGASLTYEIEQWDAAARKAAIWVKVDTIRGNNSTQSITMYWGNPDAPASSNSAAVFDTAAGFQGVWHLGETGNETAYDATANGFDGNAYNLTGGAGIIGNAGSFNGRSSYIAMPNTARGRLNFRTDDYFSISTWVYVDNFDSDYHTIVSKGYHQYFLQLSQIPRANLWQFAVFKDTSIWKMSHTTAVANQWVLLTAVNHGAEQDLYCNGELVAKSSATSETYDQKKLSGKIIFRDTSEDFTIGRFFREADFPLAGYCYFKGMVDEVRICSTARSADWIKLCYMNQRSDDKLVQFE